MAEEAVSKAVSVQIRMLVYYRVDVNVGRRVRAELHRWVADWLMEKSRFDDLSIKWIAGQIRQQANDQEE